MKSLKFLLLFFLLFTFAVFAQKVVYDLGYTTTGGKYTTGVTLDTTSGTSSNVIFFIGEKDYYPFDINPLRIDTSGVIKINSNRFYIGTLYSYFDANVAADSVIYTIKSYPGFLSTPTAIPSAKWGSAVTLSTVRSAGDFMTVTNVWVDSSAYKSYPPEVLKIEYAPVADSDNDDSTSVSWKFVYPVLDTGGMF